MTSPRRAGGTPLASRFLIVYALAYIVLIGLMGVFIDRVTSNALIEDVEANLEIAARLAATDVPADPALYQEWASDIFEVGGFRATLIDVRGVVLADSHSDPAVMENHAARPEVVEALGGEVGRARRVSASTGFDQLYVALPPEDGLMVRTSVPTRVIDEEIASIRRSIILISILIGLLGVAVVAVLARRLATPITQLTEQTQAVAEGQPAVAPQRSAVRELDQLGLAVSTIAEGLGSRVRDAEQASATLEVVLGAIPQGTILFDGDDRMVYANPSARAILGVVPETLGGLAPLQLQAAVREARSEGTSEPRLVDHGKPARKLRGTATSFSDDDRVLLVIVDITDRERTDSIRRDFVANASHELKTPVATIIAAAEALHIALDREDPSAAGFATQIEASARQLDRLVADLLDLSRLEREAPELAPVRMDLLVGDEVDRIRGRAGEKDVAVGYAGTDASVQGSHRDLAIATRNLLDNAVRHTPQGGQVDVSVRIEGDDVVLIVTDSGEGIPTRDLERVFERFYRVDSARSRGTGGTGLGLSIVKHVAETHGGDVSVESELGRGSSFTMRLPASQDGGDSGDN